jgi:hypothetical protein
VPRLATTLLDDQSVLSFRNRHDQVQIRQRDQQRQDVLRPRQNDLRDVERLLLWVWLRSESQTLRQVPARRRDLRHQRRPHLRRRALLQPELFDRVWLRRRVQIAARLRRE